MRNQAAVQLGPKLYLVRQDPVWLPAHGDDLTITNSDRLAAP